MVKPVRKLELTNNPYDKHFDSWDMLTISEIIAKELGDDADNWHGSWSINVELHYD